MYLYAIATHLILPSWKDRNSAFLPPSGEFQNQQNDKGNIGARWHLHLPYSSFVKQNIIWINSSIGTVWKMNVTVSAVEMLCLTFTFRFLSWIIAWKISQKFIISLNTHHSRKEIGIWSSWIKCYSKDSLVSWNVELAFVNGISENLSHVKKAVGIN